MAIGKQRETGDGNFDKKLYKGFAKLRVAGPVNPNKEELSEIYNGATINQDPIYVGKSNDGNDQVRVDIYLKSDEEDIYNILTKVSFYVERKSNEASTGKVEVINAFGKTTWLDPQDINNGTVPANMSWYDTRGLRVAYSGEGALMDFLQNYLNLPGIQKAADSPEDAMCQLENMENLIAGDVAELREAMRGCNNKVQVVLGIKTVERDGEVKDYQAVYSKKVFRGWLKADDVAEKFQQDIEKAIKQGYPPKVDYGTYPFLLTEQVDGPRGAAPLGANASFAPSATPGNASKSLI
jgi:hypothetical protein